MHRANGTVDGMQQCAAPVRATIRLGRSARGHAPVVTLLSGAVCGAVLAG